MAGNRTIKALVAMALTTHIAGMAVVAGRDDGRRRKCRTGEKGHRDRFFSFAVPGVGGRVARKTYVNVGTQDVGMAAAIVGRQHLQRRTDSACTSYHPRMPSGVEFSDLPTPDNIGILRSLLPRSMVHG